MNKNSLNLSISPKDIMELLDLEPCMEVGMIMTAVENAVINGKLVNEADSILMYILDLAKTLKLKD